MTVRLISLFFFLIPFHSFGSATGIYHQFEVPAACSGTEIFPPHSAGKEKWKSHSNYPDFLDQLVEKFMVTDDPCTIMYLLNLETFFHHLLETNNPKEYEKFVTLIANWYANSRGNDRLHERTCQYDETGERRAQVNRCRSDAYLDIAMILYQSWYNFFKSDQFWSDMMDGATQPEALTAGGVGLLSVIVGSRVRFVRGQATKIGKTVLKTATRTARSGGRFFTRRVTVGGGATGTGAAATSGNAEHELVVDIDDFPNPLEIIIHDDDNIDGKFGPEGRSFYKSSALLAGQLTAGIAPAVIGGWAATAINLRLGQSLLSSAYLAGSRAAPLLKAPIPQAKVLGAIAGAYYVGVSLFEAIDSWELEDKIKYLNSERIRLARELINANPNDPQTYLMAQEFILFTETLAMTFAAPIIAAQEKVFNAKVGDALCRPLQLRHNNGFMDYDSWMDDIRVKSANELERVANQVHTEFDNYYDIALRVIREGMWLFNDIGKQDENFSSYHYHGLKIRLYDAAALMTYFQEKDNFLRKSKGTLVTALSQGETHALSLQEFTDKFSEVNDPKRDMSPDDWNKYFNARDFYIGTQMTLENNGYEIHCGYGQFPRFFLQHDHKYKYAVPCDSPWAKRNPRCNSEDI